MAYNPKSLENLKPNYEGKTLNPKGRPTNEERKQILVDAQGKELDPVGSKFLFNNFHLEKFATPQPKEVVAIELEYRKMFTKKGRSKWLDRYFGTPKQSIDIKGELNSVQKKVIYHIVDNRRVVNNGSGNNRISSADNGSELGRDASIPSADGITGKDNS